MMRNFGNHQCIMTAVAPLSKDKSMKDNFVGDQCTCYKEKSVYLEYMEGLKLNAP